MTRTMFRSRPYVIGASGVAAVGAVAAVLVGGPSAANPQGGHDAAPHLVGVERIVGSVGPGFDISVRPRRVAPGTYRVVVDDRSSMHNWHITGPGVRRKTGIAFQGTQRFTIRVTRGRYRIQCDVHPTTMVTHLRVRG